MGKVAIIGSGHGGCTAAAYLGKRGHETRLYDSEAFAGNLTAIREHGGLELTGADTGFGPIAMATTDLDQVLDGVKMVLVIVPGFGHKPIAKDIATHLKDGQIVVLAPGSVFGALEFKNELAANGCKADVVIGETASNYFACRRIAPDKVRVTGIKKYMPLATIPASKAKEATECLCEFFPNTIAWDNIVHTSFADLNAIVHPIGTVLNTGWLETTKGNFDFYWEGISPGVARAMERLDEEKVAVGKALGFTVQSQLSLIQSFYGHPERTTLHEWFSKSEVNGGTGPSAPQAMTNRYVTEDVPYGLVPMAQLGHAIGVPTPNMDAVINLCSSINDENYWETGRTLKSLGLEGLEKDAIVRRLTEGK